MKRLYDLDPNEVSLVAKGANKKKFLIYKSVKGKDMAKNKNDEIRRLIDSVDPKLMARVEKVVKGMKVAAQKEAGDMLPKKDSATFKDAGAVNQVGVDEPGLSERGEGKPISDRAQAALKAMARIAAPFKDELHHEHIKQALHEVGIQGHESPGDSTGHAKIEMSQMACPEGVEEEHHVEAMKHAGEMANKSYAEKMQKLGYRQHPDPSLDEANGEVNKDGSPKVGDPEEEEEGEGKVGKSAVTKSDGGLDLSAFPKEQRPQLEAIFKNHKELVQKNQSLEKDLKAERDARVLREFEEKASKFKHLGTNTSELAQVMKSLSETDPKALAKIEKTLAAADEQISKGSLFDEIGTRRGAAGPGADAEAKLEALVDSVVEKSDGDKSREDIYSEVLKSKEGKRLYKEMMTARPGGI